MLLFIYCNIAQQNAVNVVFVEFYFIKDLLVYA